jgi:hypothetical protein
VTGVVDSVSESWTGSLYLELKTDNMFIQSRMYLVETDKEFGKGWDSTHKSLTAP